MILNITMACFESPENENGTVITSEYYVIINKYVEQKFCVQSVKFDSFFKLVYIFFNWLYNLYFICIVSFLSHFHQLM